MDERILEFIGDLRRAELRISPSEALDALAAATEVGLDTREGFKAALSATLVKEARDEATFERIFNLYFLDLQALKDYSSIKVRKLRDLINDPADPLPAYQVGGKILVRRSEFDGWIAKRRRGVGELDGIVHDVLRDLEAG